MPAYRQDSSFYEDHYGNVTITFIVSDTYDGVFGEEFITTNIFLLNESSKDLEETEGLQSEDEIRLKMNEILAETEDDLDAIAFVLAATNPVNKRFCAVFINAGATPSVSDAEFTGVLRPDFKASDLQWHGSPFTSEPTPLREWDLTAQSFFTSVFDEVEVKDLIEGNDELMVEEINSAGWVDSNVADREGYARLTGDRTTKYVQLVNLNKLLLKMGGQLTDSLSARGLGEYVINFEPTTLDFKLTPVRFNHFSYKTHHTRYVSAYNSVSFVIKTNDAVPVVMGDTSTDVNSMYVSYALFDPTVAPTPPGGKEGTYKITDNIKKYTDLLYAIAANIGCFVEYYYTDSTTLNIAFRPRRSILKGPVYVRDVAKADLNTKPRNSPDGTEKYYADVFGLATEGIDTYRFMNMDGGMVYQQSAQMNGKRPKNRLPLSVGVTLRWLLGGRDDGEFWSGGKYPHNCRFYDGDEIAKYSGEGGGDEATNSQGITTAIYINVERNGEYGFTDGDRLYAPAAKVTAHINGDDKEFASLSEYINHITARDSASFETEYNLTIPFLCGFRKSQDGTHADDDGGRGSWKNLKLGSEITIDTIEYAVVGIKRALDKPETTLRLHNVSRFSFGEAEALTDELTAPIDDSYSVGGIVSGEDAPPNTKSNRYELYIPGEAIIEGDFVSQLADGKVYKSCAYHTHVLRCVGIATQTVDEDEEVIRVLTEGRFESERYTFIPGSPIFIRTSDEGDFNGSHTQLDATTDTEDTYISIAQAFNSSSLVIRRGDEFVYYPRISDI